MELIKPISNSRFSHKVELPHTLHNVAVEWCYENFPDSGDDDPEGWVWTCAPVTEQDTHIFSFLYEEQATLFALTWS
jgi:hypothetical protein